MNGSGKVLLIDDDPGISAALQRVLSLEGYQVLAVERGDEGLARAQAESFDMVLSDLRMPGLGGLELVEALHQAKPLLPIVLMTAHGTTETAIRAMQLGAFEYLLKPFEMEELIALVRKAVSSSRLCRPLEIGIDPVKGEAIVGNSRAMQTIYKEIGRVASTPATVLIRGETGTGKEMIARAIYLHSKRAGNAFIAVNCAAIPETLLESELFGHDRGAFTGAETRRIGRFEQADKGTIFLDEIGELSLNTQAKLLRVLQERTLQRLGGKEVIPVDIRVIAATHCNLEEAMAEGKFRQDLYYRLNVVNLQLPPLRQRVEDIPALVQYFLRRYAADMEVGLPDIQPEAMVLFQKQSWQGNVRELENVIRQLLLLVRGFSITREHVQEVVERGNRPAVASGGLAEWVAELIPSHRQSSPGTLYDQAMEQMEKELFSQILKQVKGNQAQAARWLGISRLTLREKLMRYHLHPSQE